MKKLNNKFLPLLVLGLVFTFASSEELKAQMSVFISPEIGIQSSKFNTTGDMDVSGDWQGMDVNYSGIFSYQGGFGVGIQFAERWGLMTGLKFNRKGGKLTVETRDPNNPFGVTLEDGTQTTDVGEFVQITKSNWLSIPILARAQFGNDFKVGLAIGPQINMGIGKYSQNTEYNLENVNLPDEEEKFNYGESTANVLKKSHVSLLILPYASYAVNKNSSLRLSVMFESGADMINENYVVPSATGGSRNVNGTIKNSQIGVMLSYEYRFDFNVGMDY